MKTVQILLLLSLIPLCQSNGFLILKLTSDQDCLVHLEVGSTEYSETVRLLAYETRSLEVSVPEVTDRFSVDFQILHHFSGDSRSEVSTQEYKLKNNGVWESRVIDSDNVILSIQSVFHCENGFFGPICERVSRNIPTYSTTTPTPFSSKSPIIGFQITNQIVIYISLALLVLLLIIANIILCFCRPKKSKFMDENIIRIEEISTSQEENTYEYLDAQSKFLSSTVLETQV